MAWRGRATYPSSEGDGGGGLEQGYGSAKFNSSRIMNSTVDSNLFGFFAAGGGAVRMIDPGSLTLNSSVVSGNRVLNNLTFGGAIENIYGTVTANSSPVQFNTASGPGAAGGGIYDDYGQVYLMSSPVLHNTPDNCSPTGSVAGCS